MFISHHPLFSLFSPNKFRSGVNQFILPKVIVLLSRLGFIFWITAFLFLPIWTEFIFYFKDEGKLQIHEILLFLALSAFLLLVSSKHMLEKLFFQEDKVITSVRKTIGSVLVIFAVIYKITMKIEEKKVTDIKKSRYMSEIEGVKELEKKLMLQGIAETVYPYLNLEKLISIAKENKLAFIPLSMPSRSYVVLCYKEGRWIDYKTDRFGFRNQDDLVWEYEQEKRAVDNAQSQTYLIAGDDLSHKTCPEKSIAQLLQEAHKSKSTLHPNETRSPGSGKDLRVIDITSRGENVLMTLMKLYEFFPSKVSTVIVILSWKSFYSLSKFWNKKAVELYIKTDTGQRMKQNKNHIDSVIENELKKRVVRMSSQINYGLIRAYEKIYTPWMFIEFIRSKRTPDKTDISDIDVELGTFVLKKIIDLINRKNTYGLFVFVINNRPKLKKAVLDLFQDFSQKNGHKTELILIENSENPLPLIAQTLAIRIMETSQKNMENSQKNK